MKRGRMSGGKGRDPRWTSVLAGGGWNCSSRSFTSFGFQAQASDGPRRDRRAFAQCQQVQIAGVTQPAIPDLEFGPPAQPYPGEGSGRSVWPPYPVCPELRSLLARTSQSA